MDQILGRLAGLTAIAASAAFALSVAHMMGLLLALDLTGIGEFISVADILNVSPIIAALFVVCWMCCIPAALILGRDNFHRVIGASHPVSSSSRANLIRSLLTVAVLVAAELLLILFDPWLVRLLLPLFLPALVFLIARALMPYLWSGATGQLAFLAATFVSILVAAGGLGYVDGLRLVQCPVVLIDSSKRAVTADGYLIVDRGVALVDVKTHSFRFVTWATVGSVSPQPCRPR